jgi:aryl-alcohol dehydrogenase
MPIPPPPSVFGHEGAGVVEKVGEGVTKVKPGDHVVISWDYCGVCPSCKLGNPPNCRNFFLHNFHGARPDGSITIMKEGIEIHGNFFNQSSFASHALANERNVVKVRDDISLDILGPLGCGVMTGAGTVMNSLHPKPGSSVAVFGIGTVGLSAILGAVVSGCSTIIAVARREASLETARDMGATHTINTTEENPVDAVRDITGGGADFTLECAGSPEVLRWAVDSLGRLGVCAALGVVAPGTEVKLDMDLLMNGRTVKGVVEGEAIPELFIPKLIEFYRQGRLPFNRIIKHYPFEEINRAIEDMEQRRVLKPVLCP